MPEFSKISEDRLITCHHDLQRLFREVVKNYDCRILCGHRGQAEQDRLFRVNASKVQFPNSKHNSSPAMAVDVAPYFQEYPHLRWTDYNSFYNFIGYVEATANMMGIKIRSGGDWDSDHDFSDQKFNDLVHFELIP